MSHPHMKSTEKPLEHCGNNGLIHTRDKYAKTAVAFGNTKYAKDLGLDTAIELLFRLLHTLFAHGWPRC